MSGEGQETMMQTVDKIKPCYPLFGDDDYKASLKAKRDLFEEATAQTRCNKPSRDHHQGIPGSELPARSADRRSGQGLPTAGRRAVLAGFEKTLPYVHGSQGCVAYFRSYFNRHFKEPIACVSDSMTEDAAVFGGQKNMFDGLENAKALYKPTMIAVSTTCMAEVIGDDLNAFINNAKKAGHRAEYPVPFAHTPSFVGSHVTGWDNMMEGILRCFTLNKMEGKVVGSSGKVNVVPGFETYLGNYRVIKRMLGEMDVDYTMLSDPTEVLDTPADGEYRMYAGGTTIAEVEAAPNAATTLLLQPWHLEKTKKFVETTWNHDVPKLNIPMGVDWTDELLMKVSEVTGKPIPDSLAKERGRCMDLISDSHAWLHGKKFAVYGDPDFVLGMVKILLECGAEPTHILAHNGNKRWAKGVQKLLDSSPFGVNGKVYVGNDLWHLRSLCFTDKPDFLIGSSCSRSTSSATPSTRATSSKCR